MPFIKFLPGKRKIPVEIHKTILNIALENDIPIEHKCGGICACTSCIIQITTGLENFNEISPHEIYQLKKANKTKRGFRLACMCYIIKDTMEDIIINLK